MARKRMIDPEFFLDEELAKLSPHARLLYIGLWHLVDDRAHSLPNKPGWIKAQLFPYENIDIDVLLNELLSQNKIILFDYNGKEYSPGQYYFIKNFGKYQRIDRPSEQKYPRYSTTLDEYSTNTRSEVKLSKDKIREDKPSSNDEFLSSLKDFPAYKHINVKNELDKMDAWLLLHPKRKKTRRFVINWLNRIEVPMEVKPAFQYNKL